MKIGFIDYYLDEWHANNYPEQLRLLSGGEIEVAYAFAEIDAPHGLTTDEWCKKHGIRRIDTIEELVALSDGIVILSPDNCERHEALCQIPLASGKPCYVDKAFAPDRASAERIFANAEKHGTPCYSTSALRYSTEYRDIDPDDVLAVSSWGQNSYEIYSIHQLEPVLTFINSTPTQVMMNVCGSEWYSMLIRFADGRMASITGFCNGSPFVMNIAGKSGNRMIEVKSDFFAEFLKELIRFFKTGEAHVAHQTTINIMAVREAGYRAMKNPGIWVEV